MAKSTDLCQILECIHHRSNHVPICFNLHSKIPKCKILCTLRYKFQGFPEKMNNVRCYKQKPGVQLFEVQSWDLHGQVLQPYDPVASNFLLQAVSESFLCPTENNKECKIVSWHQDCRKQRTLQDTNLIPWMFALQPKP